MGAITHLTNDNFDQSIGLVDRLVLVDYWAPWCAPCRALAPIVEDLATDFGEDVNFHKLDVEANPALREKMQIQGIPVLALYRGGAELERKVGIKSRAELTEWLERHL